jgi:hypothetical protein
MESLTDLQKAVHLVLERFKRPVLSLPNTQRHILMDDQTGHYQVLNIGWHELKRTFEVIVHINIHNDLIWIQVDNTEPGIADSLLEQGIPSEKIVLAFHAPYKRPYTGFAVGE